MQQFFSDDLTAASQRCTLSGDEAHHAVNVLRLKQGQDISLMNGKGVTAVGTVSGVSKKQVEIGIREIKVQPKPKVRLTVCFGLIKTRQRLEWALEKITESGADTIILMHTEHTERQHVRIDRLNGIVVSAAKQSLSARLPDLNEAKLTDLLEELKENHYPGTRYVIAHEKAEGESGSTVADYFRSEDFLKNTREIYCFIGPEGGFSPDEIQAMKTLPDASLLWLGPRRLRAETAAVQLTGLFRLSGFLDLGDLG